MQKDTMNARQAICLIILFIFGSSAILGGNTKAEQDSWISMTIAAAAAAPVVIMYARIIRLYPEQNFFEIIEKIFGKFIGKIIITVITAYAIELAALVIRNFTEFVHITMMPETPQLPLMIMMLAVTSMLAFSGARVLGKWSVFVLPVILFILVFILLASLNKMDVSNLQPVFNHNIVTILNGSLRLFSFPFAEIVLFLTISSSVQKGDNPYKIYLLGLLFGFLIMLFLFLRNLTILGVPLMSSAYFPSYTAVRIVSIGKFLTRIEGTIMTNFMLGGITKISLCLLGACKGSAKLFHVQNYKTTLLPVAVIVLLVCYFHFNSSMQMIYYANNVYPYYAIPIQVVLPLIIWIGAEIKTRKQKDNFEEKEVDY